jgi:hypothetical protein
MLALCVTKSNGSICARQNRVRISSPLALSGSDSVSVKSRLVDVCLSNANSGGCASDSDVSWGMPVWWLECLGLSQGCQVANHKVDPIP